MNFQRLAFHLFSIAPVLCSLISARADEGRPPIVVDRFTGKNFVGWEASGEAFARGPAAGAELLRQLEIENVADLSLACSEMDGDPPQGRLRSKPFTIERNYIAFRIGGGDYEAHTCANLIVDDRVVCRAVGWRSDRLTPTSWDVRKYAGKAARFEIVDEASGDWGHILVDDIVQTDSPETLPNPTTPLYAESLRPQFHITARQWTMNRLNPGMREEGWINDLNGMIYYDGEYHVFAQRWNKCWLHFVSRDLIHWEELEPAFWEPSLGFAVQSGHSVIDYHNTSKLSPNPDQPPFIAFWSDGANRAQHISFSLDHGRTWKFYDQNPVLAEPERDPKVFWYEPGQHWCMLLYGDGKYRFFTSKNLLNWQPAGGKPIDGYECPDFFELTVDADPNLKSPELKKWVLVHGDGGYQLGSFDGRCFVPDFAEREHCSHGDYYATQTFENTATNDGRRIQIAWMRFSQFPDMPFSQQLTFPGQLSLRTTADGPRVFREPIAELQQLHRGEATWQDRTLAAGERLLLQPAGQLYHVRGQLKVAPPAKAILRIRGVDVVFADKRASISDYHCDCREPITSFEVLVDRTSIELFVNRGEQSIAKFEIMRENGLSMRAEGGEVQIESLQVYPLNSIWPTSADTAAAGEPNAN
ncbi:MAG: GH32 C-terminal domain-containing protein [Pirellulales bacterium]